MPHDWPEPFPPGIDFLKAWKPKPGSSIGPMVTLPAGFTMTPTPIPFAYEIESDGQKVRLESPTLEGLLVLIQRTEDNDADDQPHVVQGS